MTNHISGPRTIGAGAPRPAVGLPVVTLPGAAPSGNFEYQDIVLLPGEEPLFAADFSASPILRHIKTGVMITQARVVMRYPQFILGFIRVGHAESACPLAKLSGVTVGRSLNRSRLFKGLFFGGIGAMVAMSGLGAVAVSIIGLPMLLIGLIMLGIGAFQLWMARSLGLTVSNDGGSILHVDVERPEYQDMITAGQLIQELMIAGTTQANNRTPTPAKHTVAPPQAPQPAPVVPPAQQFTPPPVPRPQTASAPYNGSQSPAKPSIWRG